MTRSLPALVVLCGAVLALGTGCDRSCSKLADKLCERVSLSNDKNPAEQCDKWRERTKRVAPQTCQAALRTLQQDRQPE